MLTSAQISIFIIFFVLLIGFSWASMSDDKAPSHKNGHIMIVLFLALFVMAMLVFVTVKLNEIKKPCPELIKIEDAYRIK